MKIRTLLVTVISLLIVGGQRATAQSHDINGDGAVNVADIATVIDVMAGKALEFKDKADTNDDGTVNVADIAAIIDAMAGKSSDPLLTNYSSCPDDKHPHWIDLGLPSRTKWACCNLGAKTAFDLGDYYAWGETQPKTEYSWYTYKHWVDDNEDEIVSLNELRDLGHDISGEWSYDAATHNWGAPNKMPNREQYKELIDNCTWDWKTLSFNNGEKLVLGMKVTGPNGKYIFMRAAGYMVWDYYDRIGYTGYYWLSNHFGSPGLEYMSYRICFDNHIVQDYSYTNRCYGLPIRAVRND